MIGMDKDILKRSFPIIGSHLVPMLLGSFTYVLDKFHMVDRAKNVKVIEFLMSPLWMETTYTESHHNRKGGRLTKWAEGICCDLEKNRQEVRE